MNSDQGLGHSHSENHIHFNLVGKNWGQRAKNTSEYDRMTALSFGTETSEGQVRMVWV